MARSTVRFDTKISGPFFQLRDEALRDAERATIEDLVKEGEAKAQSVLKPGKGVQTGAYQKSIHGRLLNTALGEIDEDNSVKGKWLESGRMRGSRFRGYGAFRKAKAHLLRVANEMAGRQYKRAVQRLT